MQWECDSEKGVEEGDILSCSGNMTVKRGLRRVTSFHVVGIPQWKGGRGG